MVVAGNICGINAPNGLPVRDASAVCYEVRREIESNKAGRAKTWWKVVLVVDTEASSAAERIHTANGRISLTAIAPQHATADLSLTMAIESASACSFL